MRVTHATALTVALALALAASAGAQPNVVLIVTDDQRWDTIRYMPTVQRELVGRGVLFENAFAVNPLCCPSRASILTGLYSHSNGVWSNSGPHGGMRVFDDRSTLPVWLDDVGYETMLIGKYINGYTPSNVSQTYVPPGWNRWRAFYGAPGYFTYRLSDGTAVRAYGPDPAEYSTDVFAAEATRFVRESPSPFFLYLAPFAPHQSAPFTVDPAPRHVDAFAGRPYTQRPSVNERNVNDKPARIRRRGFIARARLTELREEQLETLLAVDEAIAGILTALEETGKLDETLIVFTSDNGYSWGEHRWAGKRVPYEESIRVPLVIRHDGVTMPGRVESRLALNVDLAPTIAHAAGVRPRGRDGRSLLPLLAGSDSRWRSRFLIEYYDPPFLQAYCGLREQRWKYVQHSTGEEELYDLRTDRYERQSLHRRNVLTSRLMSFRGRVRRSACRPPGFRPLARCTLSGTARADRLVGTSREDWICAGAGNDRIRVGGGNRDVVFCGRGKDRVQADRLDRLKSCEIVTR
jgi:N-acetylglucosamine-6-sulfatase